ncbi:MAG: GAF domain-containing protein [Leptolyngbyaceae cyanobacterium bins.349]|nr:GAF domain-containing protein [Leptolyngbyaceae cyanobacterium bins.349]
MGVTLPKSGCAHDRQHPPALLPAMTLSNSVSLSENCGETLLNAPSGSPSLLELHQCLQSLQAQLPPSPELEQLQAGLAQLEWLQTFHQTSQLLIAVINPLNSTLQYANHYCCQLLNIDAATMPPAQGRSHHLRTILKQRLSDSDYAAVLRLYRRHLFHFMLRQLYQVDASVGRLLETPAMVALPSPHHAEPRYVEFWLRSQNLQITRLNSDVDEFADLHLADLSSEQWQIKLTDPGQLDELEQRFCLTNYRFEGCLVLEGLDVTVRETIHRITQLLIDRDSILLPHKFRQVNQQLRSLFRTDNTVILTVEKDQIRVFMGYVGQDIAAITYPLELLQNSHTLKAIQSNQVLAVQDLAQDCRTELGQHLLQQGVRSLLLIPLVAQSTLASVDTVLPDPSTHPSVVGLVGLMSDRPYHFDRLDCCHAEQLIPAFTRALTSAQRQLVQQRFITNIHPAVEWRFLQEAERRSLGLPAEPIVFEQVYPLYGISDIRGSSEARNSAIQADLLAQFQLGLAVVDAVCETDNHAISQQLRLDLLERMEQLQKKITVDAEVTEIRYLRNHLEAYFDYFAQCGKQAIAAIDVYQAACNNEHECIYVARAEYDRAISQINAQLRDTWERWQQRMQQITPHYCDIETTDGIDHMIYAGHSIDPKFGKFQLRSLRYEQLRALCDCARVAFRIQTETPNKMQVTHLVLVQDATVDIFHDETTEKLFDVRGTRDTRYEIVKKRIDKAIDEQTHTRITQPGMLTLVYSTTEELEEYEQYLHYLMREGLVDREIDRGTVEPLQGVTGLKFVRVRVLPDNT